MNGLPALLSRPRAVLPDQAAPAPADGMLLRAALDSGLPVRLPLSGDRVLVLSVGLGRARAVMAADPADVVVAAGGTATTTPAATTPRDPDVPIARMSLVEGSTLGDSVPVVAGVPATLTVAGRAVAAVTVETIALTAGSLRSPGEYSSSVTLRWRHLGEAGDAGPTLPPGDDSIPRLRPTAMFRRERRWTQ